MINLNGAKRVVCIGNSDGFLDRVNALTVTPREGLAFGVIDPNDFATKAPGAGVTSLGIRISELAEREPKTVFVIDSENVTAAKLARLYAETWNGTPEANQVLSI